MVSERPAGKAPPAPPDAKPPGEPVDPGHRPDSRSPWFLWGMAGVVLALALFVVFILPYMASGPPATVSPVAETPPLQAEPVTEPGVASHEAAQVLQDYLRQRAAPSLTGAAEWGEPQWSESVRIAEEGDRLMGRRQYARAREAYRKATALLQELEQDRPRRLRAFFDEADALLAENRPADALRRYRLALLMEPDDAAAKRGLERAGVRDQVLALMDTGSRAETGQRLEEAAAAYREALDLDGDWQPARAALARVEETMAEQGFRQAIDDALARLDRGQLGAAAAALERAATIEPAHPAVADLRTRLAAARKQARLASLRSQVRKRVAAEDWAAAVELYRKALQIEPRDSTASAGMARAQDRVRLHRQLEHYLADPMRIYSPEPLANAEKLLESNRAIPAAEPKLRASIARLRELVAGAKQPREVVLRSDGETEVTVYHVGRLGRFTEKRLSLRPGKYTAVGARPGCRDVRHVFTVLPDRTPDPVIVRCEEPL